MIECSCDECKEMCRRRPCYGTPVEIWKIIKAGFGQLLMVDWWEKDRGLPYTEILCPAIVGSHSGMAPKWPQGPCVLQDENGLCPLHDLGLKPTEAKEVSHDYCPDDLHFRMVKTWDTWMGRKIVEIWKKEFMIDK